MTEGYPSRTTKAGSLPMDHFLRPPKPQTKWYGLYSDQQLDPATVTSWHTGPAKLNNSFGRIARKAALAATPPASRRISQDTLRRWERTAREASVVYNQTASFNRCLFKVQGDMQAQLKVIRLENKGKVSLWKTRVKFPYGIQLQHHTSDSQGNGTLDRLCFHYHGKPCLGPSRLIPQPLKEWSETGHLCCPQDRPTSYSHLVLRIGC